MDGNQLDIDWNLKTLGQFFQVTFFQGKIDQKQQYSLDVPPLKAGPLQLIGQVILNKLQSTPDNSNPG